MLSSAAPAPPEQLPVSTGLLGLGILAATVDAALTWFAMRVADAHHDLVFAELNPAMRNLIHHLGGLGAMGARIILGVLILGFLAWAGRRSRWRWRPLALATVLTWAVVVWNIGVLYTTVG